MGREAGQRTIRRIVFPTNALALLVQTELKLDPHSGITVVFRSRRGDRLKIAVWQDEEGQETIRGTVSPTNGLVLVCKVLEQGSPASVKTGPEGINPSSGRIEGTRARSAGVAGRDDAVVTGAVRGLVRRSDPPLGECMHLPGGQRAPDDGAAGRSTHCGGMVHPSVLTLFYWPFLSGLAVNPQPACRSQFPDLPPEVMKALEVVQFEVLVERAARQHEQAVGAEKDAFIPELTALVGKLKGQIGRYRHAKFGPKSEKLDPAQLEPALEDLETAIAETQAQIAAVKGKIAAGATVPRKAAPHAPRQVRALPEPLPRTLRVIEPDSIACGCGAMVRHWSENNGEGHPRIRWKAVGPPRRCWRRSRCPSSPNTCRSTVRPWSWRDLACRLTVGFWPTLMGRTGALNGPMVDHMAVALKQGSTRLYVDKTTAPVLDPGREKTRTGYLRAVLRDGEPLRHHWFDPGGEGLERHRAAGRRLPLSPRAKRGICRRNIARLQRHDPG